MLNKTNGSNVSTGYDHGKLLPTKKGFETFATLPVKIVNGIVSNRKDMAYGVR